MFEPVSFSHHCPEMTPFLIVLIIFFAAFVVLVATIIKIIIFCKIFSRAGYSWAMGLLTLIPFVDIILAFFLAFADWPVCKELRKLKQQLEKSRM